MTTFYTLLESQKQEYIEWLKLWIVKQNAAYLKDVEYWRDRTYHKAMLKVHCHKNDKGRWVANA